MAKHIRKSKKDIGVSPDELQFRGIKKIDGVVLRIISANADNLIEETIDSVQDALKYSSETNTTWFNIDGLHSAETMREISECFAIEQLVLAEVMDTESRPKVQEYSNCLLLSLKMIRQESEDSEIEIEKLSLILTHNMLFSFQERVGDVFEPIRERIRKGKRRIRSGKPDYLAFAIIDVVIDNYIYVLSNLGDKIESLESKLLSDNDDSVIDEINAHKRTLHFLRKNILPAKEMLLALVKMDSEFMHKNTEIYYKELQSNINQAIETTEGYREILSDQLNIYHTKLSTKLNDTMKFLTIFSVIFIPLTFIAGIYGTNFDYLPELHFKYSYFIMWGLMVVITVLMLYYFKRKKWF